MRAGQHVIMAGSQIRQCKLCGSDFVYFHDKPRLACSRRCSGKLIAIARTKHGCAGSRAHHHSERSPEERAVHRIWVGMRTRCNNPNANSYEDYGGRGIRVCERWDDFSAFLADVGPRPGPRHSIDRMNNDGDYEPGNVKWSTDVEQASNRRNRCVLTFCGETLTVPEWSERTGIKHNSIKARINMGWSVERALTEPIARGNQRSRKMPTNEPQVFDV